MLQLFVAGVVPKVQNRDSIVDLKPERMNQIVDKDDVLQLTIRHYSQILDIISYISQCLPLRVYMQFALDRIP